MITEGTLTVTAGQNTVEEELTSTITVMTAEEEIEFATITVTQNAYGAVEITVDCDSWHAPAVGGLSTEIIVTATAEWDVENASEWLTVEKTDTGITLTAEENELTEERAAEVTLTCTDGISSDSVTIKVTQDGLAYITLDAEELSFSYIAGEAEVKVESNYDWEFSFEENDWLTVQRDEENSSLTLSYGENATGEAREAVISFTASDGAENVAEAVLNVSQESLNPDALILIYNIPSGNTQIKAPIASVTKPTVDWGDGTVETVTSANPSHTYADAGEYTVMVYDGTVKQIKSATSASASITGAEYLTAVKQWGTYTLTSMQYAFCGCENLASLPEGAGPFASVTTFQYAFSKVGITSVPEGLFSKCGIKSSYTFEYCFTGCPSLETIPDGLFSGCAKASSFASVFSKCPALKEIPADLFKGCTAATAFSSAFRYDFLIEKIPSGLFDDCTAAQKFDYVFSFYPESGDMRSVLTEIPEGIFDKNTEATTFDHAFYGCNSLKSLPAKLFVNNTKVTTYTYCFYNCTSLASIPSDLFGDQPAAATLSQVFHGCSSLTNDSIPTTLLEGCTAATTVEGFFYGCTGLTSLPTGLFDKCTKVTNFNSVFRGCTGLKSLTADFFAPLTSATSFNYIFYGCTGLTEIPADLFSTNTDVTTFNNAFQDCTGLTGIPAGLFDNCTKVTSMTSAFQGCTKLTGESPYTMIDDTKVHLYERGNYTSSFSTISTHTNCFTGCTQLSDYADILEAGWAAE